MDHSQPINSLILFSGGLDSLAALHFYQSHNYTVKLLFVDYNHLSNTKEFEAVKAISSYAKVSYSKIKVESTITLSDGFICGRNSLLIFSALFINPFEQGTIAMGLHKGLSYVDCSQDFLIRCQSVIDTYNDRIKLQAPFLNWSKKEIWNYCVDNSLPVKMTYSCELGEDMPCGKCLSCEDYYSLRC